MSDLVLLCYCSLVCWHRHPNTTTKKGFPEVDFRTGQRASSEDVHPANANWLLSRIPWRSKWLTETRIKSHVSYYWESTAEACEQTGIRASVYHHLRLNTCQQGLPHLRATARETWEKGFLWLTSQELCGIDELMFIKNLKCLWKNCHYLNRKRSYFISSASYVAPSSALPFCYVAGYKTGSWVNHRDVLCMALCGNGEPCR